MEVEINAAIQRAKKAVTESKNIVKELESLKDSIKQSSMFNGEEKVTFIRFDVQLWPRNGQFIPGKWHQLIDTNKSRMVIKNRRGFEVVGVTKNQTVDSTKGNASMLFSDDEASREVAITVLDQLAEDKYRDKYGLWKR